MFIIMLLLPKISLKILGVAVLPMYSCQLNKHQQLTLNYIAIISIHKIQLKIENIIFKMILKKDLETKL
jgi:hypothetical protein